MHRSIRFFIALAVTLLATATPLRAAPVHAIDFEAFAPGPFTRDSWLAAGFVVPWVNGFNAGRADVDTAHALSGSRALRILYPADGYASALSGAQAPLRLPPQAEYYSAYWLRFDETFSWGGSQHGGKLPGLAGGQLCSGCNTCTGSNGFSARLMWGNEGRALLYLYHMDRAGNCGDSVPLRVDGALVRFQRGHWHHIAQRVRINTVGQHDGEVELWLDGKPAAYVDGLRFVTNGDQVDAFYFSTFHGGSHIGWSPGADVHAWFDDLVISTDPADIRYPLLFANGFEAAAATIGDPVDVDR